MLILLNMGFNDVICCLTKLQNETKFSVQSLWLQG